jgi:membrane protease YdiL (CAAX protease family)
MSDLSQFKTPIILVAMTEAAMALVGIIICFFSGVWPNWNITLATTLFGVLTGAVLFIGLRKLAFGAKASSAKWAEEVNQLREGFAEPLAKSFTPREAIVSAVLAGSAEEFFFRGTIENHLPLYTGALVAGIIFVFLHFGRKSVEWRFVSLLYLVVSLLFSTIFQSSNSLWAAAVCHGLYDYLALRFLQGSGVNLYTAFRQISR